ncbi:centrosomal protein of 112 kDa-like [Rhipicephalus sanguineus]|uniref:centrosomal protein of 112 kDa-like n=1 Tax=Rhipicephalus sanguineus TaxID=34632 RepID=UPI0020C4CF29|nr:centrosomal protein of 112 kDa-like [Rhipicephalus sanguineus]
MKAVARLCGEVAPGADDEGSDDACADEVGVDACAGSCGGPAPRDDQRRGGDASSASEGAASRNGEANTALDDAISGDTAGDCDDIEAEVKKSRDDDNAAAVKKRKKTRNKRRNRKHTHTRLTPDESESGTEVVRTRDLERDKAALEAEVDRLKQDTSQHATRISQLECELANMTDAHDGLKQEHDVYKAKATTMINEKDSHISGLKDKVRTLEKQLAQQLEESRQHYFEAKTSWSDKIQTLEAQIFNMDRKVAEDSLEYSRMERLLADAQQCLKDQQHQCAKFEEQLLERDTQLANMRRSHEEELQRQRALQDSQLDELRTQAAVLRAQLAQAQQDRDREASQAQTLIVKLNQKEAECKKNLGPIQGLEEGQRTLLAKVSEQEKQLSLASDTETILKHGLKRSDAELKTIQEELAKLNQVLASAEIENKRLMEELKARKQQADKQSRLEEVTQLQESLERVAGQVDPFEEETAAHVRNCTSVSDPQRNITEGGVRAGGICSFLGDRRVEHRRSIMLSTVVVNLSESAAPPSSGGSRVASAARVSSSRDRQPMRSHRELWADSAGIWSCVPRAVLRGQG